MFESDLFEVVYSCIPYIPSQVKWAMDMVLGRSPFLLGIDPTRSHHFCSMPSVIPLVNFGSCWAHATPQKYSIGLIRGQPVDTYNLETVSIKSLSYDYSDGGESVADVRFLF